MAKINLIKNNFTSGEAIADRAVKNYTDQHIKEVTNLINDLEIREALEHELTAHAKLNPLEALNRKLVMHTDQSGIQSVEHNIQAIEVRYIGALADVFTKTQKGLGYLIDADKVKLLVKEIFGKPSGDAEIATLAKSVQDTLEQLRLHYNRYGGDIKKLANYGIPQSHSHFKVISEGQDGWVNYTFPLVDRSKYRHEATGKLMNDDEVKEVLKAVYNTIASEGHSKASVQAHLVQSETDLPVGMNMQALHQHHREVHFKDADAWVKYQEDFGEVNFHDLLSNHIRRMSIEIGMMQTFGSNPEKLVKQLGHDLLNKMMQDPKYVKEHRKIQKQAALINKHYDELAGQALPIDSNLAQVGSMMRSFLADAISATSDPTERSVKDFVIPAAFKDVMSAGTMVSGAGEAYLAERDSSYGAEAINVSKNNIPFQNVWYSRLVFDRLVIAELQELFDEDYRERKQRRQESNHNMSYWWDLDNDTIEAPDINIKD